jgi:outer membrane protein
MKTGSRTRIGPALAIALALAGTASAQSEEGEIEKTEAARMEPTSRLAWSLGAGFIAAPRPYVGAGARTFPVPLVSVSYDRWFLQGIRGGFEWLRTERFSANAFAQPQFLGFEAADSAFLEGMADRSLSMDAGVELVYRGRPVGFRLAALSDVLGKSAGQEVSLLAVTGAPLGPGRLVLVGFGPRWSSANRVDYYYGVRASEALPGRPAYQASDTLSWDANVTLLFDINARWNVFALVNREAFGSDIRDSPLVDRNAAYSLIAALRLNF